MPLIVKNFMNFGYFQSISSNCGCRLCCWVSTYRKHLIYVFVMHELLNFLYLFIKVQLIRKLEHLYIWYRILFAKTGHIAKIVVANMALSSAARVSVSRTAWTLMLYLLHIAMTLVTYQWNYKIISKKYSMVHVILLEQL